MPEKRFLNELYEQSKKYYIAQSLSHTENIEKSKEYVGDLFYLHKIALGLLEHILSIFRNQPGVTSESISGRLALIAAFYMGIGKCEDCIMEGYYPLAAGIIRQEYEILCGVSEYKNGNRVQGKVPHVKASDIDNFGPIYGDLSVLTHLTMDNILADLVKDREQSTEVKKPISLTPITDSNMCKQMFGLHILLISKIAKEVLVLYREMFNCEPTDTILNSQAFILEILYKNSIITDVSNNN